MEVFKLMKFFFAFGVLNCFNFKILEMTFIVCCYYCFVKLFLFFLLQYLNKFVKYLLFFCFKLPFAF